MLLLALLALVPALFYTVSLINEQRRMATAAAEEQALRLARLAAARYAALSEAAVLLLEAAARLPSLARLPSPACAHPFTNLLAGSPNYVNLSVISFDGHVLCSAAPDGVTLDPASAEYFVEALRKRSVVIGSYRFDPGTAQVLAGYAHRLLDGAGTPHAFLYASVDTTWLARMAREAALPERSLFSLFDEDGDIIARFPGGGVPVEDATAHEPTIKAAVAGRAEGTTRAIGVDGIERLYAYARLASSEQPTSYVAVGIPEDFIYAPVVELQRKALIGALVAAVVLLLIINRAADWLVLRHVNALLRTTRRLAAGELSARTGIPREKGEIHQLAQTFDEMADALQTREVESRVAQEALTQSEERFRRLAENAPDVIYRYRVLTPPGFEYLSPAAQRMFGYAPEEFYADPGLARKIVHPDDRPKLAALTKGRVPETVEMRCIRKDRTIVWVEQRNVPVYDANGQRVALEGIARDITARKQTEQELRLLQSITLAVSEAEDTEAALSIVLSAVCEATGWIVGQAWVPAADGRTLACSPAWHGREPGLEAFRSASETRTVDIAGDMVQARVARERQPVWLRDLADQPDNPYRTYTAAAGLRAMVAVPVAAGAELEAIIEFFTREPRPEDEALVQTVSSVATQLGAVLRRKRSEERLSYLAHHDVLTGLPNRALFSDRLRQALYEANRQGRLVAVAFLDLDRFKNINDSLGHETGDLLLRGVADRLRANVRETDTVARISGDEFMLVLPGLVQVDDAGRIAQKILDSLRHPFAVASQELYVSASLGLTVYPHDAKDVEGLLRNADVAMYRAKETGRNAYQFYTAEMTALAHEHLQLEGALRRALERGEFVLHYQPILELATGRVIGAEALLRWRHPERGTIEPAQFIPLAEETGLITPIGEWVLATACAECVAWQRAGLGPLHLAVNISPRQFQSPELAETVTAVLRDTGLEPERLELELTEGVLLNNPETTIANMERLSAKGVGLCIDDFGTGYSSLSYIKRLPIDRLKVDRSFVQDIPGDEDDAAITSAIIAMAHNLQLSVVAEGVETLEQVAFLRAHRCDVMQGDFFSPPLAGEAFVALLRATPRLPLPSGARTIRRKIPPHVE